MPQSSSSTLHFAIKSAQLGAVKCLLQLRADVNGVFVDTRDAYTPLMLAAKLNQTATIRVLVEHKASVDAAALEGGPRPIHIASDLGNVSALAELLKFKADFTARSEGKVRSLAPLPFGNAGLPTCCVVHRRRWISQQRTDSWLACKNCCRSKQIARCRMKTVVRRCTAQLRMDTLPASLRCWPAALVSTRWTPLAPPLCTRLSEKAMSQLRAC